MLTGITCHILPKAGVNLSGWLHYAVQLFALVAMPCGIVQAIQSTSETMAKVSSIAAAISMLLFLLNVIRGARAA